VGNPAMDRKNGEILPPKKNGGDSAKYHKGYKIISMRGIPQFLDHPLFPFRRSLGTIF